jgi:hypothetical protein
MPGGVSARPRSDNRWALVYLAPVVLAATYFAVFAAQLPHNLWIIGWNSDYASGFTIPTTLAKPAAARVPS